jgi:hypothetical protein
MAEFKLSYTAKEIDEKLGKIATPDWSVNDPNAAGYVENRTHWIEMTEGVSAFDGDLTGKEYFEAGDGVVLIKMSDTSMTNEDLLGSTVIIKHNVPELGATGDVTLEYVITEDNILIQKLDDSNYLLMVSNDMDIPSLYIVHGDLSSVGVPIQEGTYFLTLLEGLPEGCYFYTHSLSCLNGMKEVVHKIDEKYLPEVGLKADEVSTMIDEAITTQVSTMIDEAIKKSIIGAIGGNY